MRYLDILREVDDKSPIKRAMFSRKRSYNGNMRAALIPVLFVFGVVFWWVPLALWIHFIKPDALIHCIPYFFLHTCVTGYACRDGFRQIYLLLRQQIREELKKAGGGKACGYFSNSPLCIYASIVCIVSILAGLTWH